MYVVSKLLVALALFSLLMPIQIYACACCSERGDYFEHESDLAQHVLNEVEKIRPASAILHTDAGYPESIIGIEPLGDTFSVLGSFKGQTWTFGLTDDKSRKASLDLWRPSRVVEFGVDQNPLDESSTVILYKELRFRYRVKSATGFLENGIDSESTFNLILQGRGNACMNASDFSTYILQIKGNKANYSFFGKLKIDEDVIMQKYVDDAGAKVAN